MRLWKIHSHSSREKTTWERGRGQQSSDRYQLRSEAKIKMLEYVFFESVTFHRDINDSVASVKV